ncbi:hypothetical protein [Liquorilactobacillus capillatus]|uniref:Uncharacterized protein n=1 Tax=Liquorilactobacillus capillatus DSM 19910 TaxID=1423731 RepID=A0A0R1MBM9_9LACO|nr:hypothetical protein [Liquorilactobacillus capillatus]KRL02530.1 hypothetical protein FC81_GL000698 [Liquorilactobacillus capillatus DSM 19910]
MAELPSLSLEYEPSPLLGGEMYSSHNRNWSKLNNYGSSLNAWLQGVMAGYDLRFNQQIQNSPQPSEVTDARIDVHGKTYSTLKARLDEEQTETPQFLDLDKFSTDLVSLKLRDLGTNSGLNISYTKISDVTIPDVQTGYESTTVDKISIIDQGSVTI